MSYNPQYIEWKSSKQSGYDWIDVLNFILISQAEFTDGKMDASELQKIEEINEITFSHWVGDDMPYMPWEPKEKLERALKWYFGIIKKTEPDKVNEALLNAYKEAAGWMKSQEWFNPTFAQSIINWLMEIAEADGSVVQNEKGSINNLAVFFGINPPYSIEN
jgi:hypothetical protein